VTPQQVHREVVGRGLGHLGVERACAKLAAQNGRFQPGRGSMGMYLNCASSTDLSGAPYLVDGLRRQGPQPTGDVSPFEQIGRAGESIHPGAASLQPRLRDLLQIDCRRRG